MTQRDQVLGIFKFGAKKHIEQFAQGRLYMNTLRYFVEKETNSLRRDSDEGTSHLWRSDGAMLSIKVGGRFVPVGELRGPQRFRPDALQNVNVFCMYALRESASETLVDARNQDFGDTFAVVLRFDEFLKRVKTAVLNTDHELQCHMVEYVDECSYQGPMGPFKKGSLFAYQSEFRIALLPGTGEPYLLEVGDLRDIVSIGPLSELNKRLRIDRRMNSR